MKHRQLHAIAHNFADSLSCGLGFVVGYRPTDIFAEAASNGGSITVDFLAGGVVGDGASDELKQALQLYRDALPGFCEKHGACVSDYRELSVRYSVGPVTRRFRVTIEDVQGRRSSIEYDGIQGGRVRVLDELGRIRPKVG